jgi:hypothetical protein
MATPHLVCDDVLHWAETYEGEPFHAMLCDAPYELNFMGRSWDRSGIAFHADTWRALAQHLLPGAFGMTFCASRGWHRLACAIEDAGLIIHPSVFMLGWAYGSGWPKATRIDTAVDKAAGAEREVTGYVDSRSRHDGRERRSPKLNTAWRTMEGRSDTRDEVQKEVTTPATDLAKTWAGHRYGGQVLKPALEPVIVWQKPYQERPVESITATGAGALWIEGARLSTERDLGRSNSSSATWGSYGNGANTYAGVPLHQQGRWPPNLALLHLPTCERLGTREVPDPHYVGPPGQAPTRTEPVWQCSPECPVRRFDEQAGERSSGVRAAGGLKFGGTAYAQDATLLQMESFASVNGGDTGPASRFMYTADWALDVAEQLAQADPVFYTGKASRGERNAGLSARNNHPTIKPISLCTWLATLLLPPAAYAPRRLVVPFCGTGTEILGAVHAGFENVLGIEQEQSSVDMAWRRLAWWTGYRSPETERKHGEGEMSSSHDTDGQFMLF